MSGFQTTVNSALALAVAGDLASANPTSSFPAGEGGLVAGEGGVTVGRFAWITGNTVLNSAASGKPDGLIHREQQALITTYLAETSNLVPAGMAVTVMDGGDYFLTATVAGATKGQKAFAKLADGTMQAGAAGATIEGFVETDFVIKRDCLVGEPTIVSAKA